ncbi:SAM-dependent methyltransferase [Methanolinea mesophila]|uniref:class I SAM-dependent methyltransferase n=1 Tax=Methanolinea mesophila TaxID=547055 RepID=UPI001AEAE62E|nr:class I SAM-dependent methyltransferase [Methanolinea mesophila]MBP1927468.1 SAM-dependent methyltransferase [Methanolinea mesophila]
MLFLSHREAAHWKRMAAEVLRTGALPGDIPCPVRKNLLPAFHFYLGTLLISKGMREAGREWLASGTVIEEDGLFSSAFLIGFLERHEGRFVQPDVVFRDPRPFIHFSGVPVMASARERFVSQATHSLPEFREPLRMMDIGCGNGTLTVTLLESLTASGKAGNVAEVMLVDPSPAMLSLAETEVREAFPDASVTTINHSFQEFSGKLKGHYDLAISSLAFHHMPIEEKRVQLARLAPMIDHFLLFELDANNDTPEYGSPELALSLYQSYGRIIDFVFSHDAPVEVAIACVDLFLITELVSFLTEHRGVRKDYHMLRSQWNDLFASSFGPEFSLRCDSPCYADEYLTLFTMHYGRE